MHIKKIIFENNIILGNTEFNFCDTKGKPFDTIILAGENGTGKSTLLNTIYGFFLNIIPSKASNEKVTFIIELTESELMVFLHDESFKSQVKEYEILKELTIKVDHNFQGNWGAVTSALTKENGEPIGFNSILLNKPNVKAIFKSIFSTVDVNFTSDPVVNTTSLDIDVQQNVVKSSINLAKEITQLLVDIDSLDNSDLAEWADQNPTLKVNERPSNTRMSRFKKAFESIFPSKRYKKIVNNANQKQILFEEFGNTMLINDLSSGEKQIVFRGSFLLKNKLSTEGAIILIDEPEISLHPIWQLKILDFYKNLFRNSQGTQTSQIIIATHSPFIIHNDSRINDKVLILKKNNTGQIIIPKLGEFLSWNRELIIKEAFDIIPFDDKDSTSWETFSDNRR